MTPAPARPRWGRIAGAAALVVLVVAVVVALLTGGGDDAPPARATQLVPAGALAYVHLSTDTGRGATRRARDEAADFPSYDALRAAVLSRVAAPQCGLDDDSVRGAEAALAIVPGTGSTAGSLLLVDSGKDEAGVRTRRCGALTVTSIGRFVAVGQPATLQQARELADGKGGASLADQADFEAATAALPADRAVDGWASATGVRQLLAPQSGVLGAAGTVLDRPGLRGAAFAVGAEDGGARVTIRSQLDPGTKATTFAPKLAEDVPASALAYFGTAGVTNAAARLLGATGSASGGVGALLGRAAQALGQQTDGALQRDVLSLLRGEVAVSLSPQGTRTVLTLQAPTDDEAGTRTTLRRLEPQLAKLLASTGQATPAWTAQGAVRRLAIAEGIELDYQVTGGRLILSTSPQGVAAAREPGDGLPSTGGWKATLDGIPDKSATSLGFLDFRRVLRLAEQSGLNDSRAYQAVRADLERIRAVGLVVTADGNHTTSELHLSIP